MTANSLMNILFPTFGSSSAKSLPIWDESQRMFIFDQHVSAAGNRSYRGIRLCENFAIVEKVGLYHSWTYINSIEIYVFRGSEVELAQKRDYDKVFHSSDFVADESMDLLMSYIRGMQKSIGADVPESEIEEAAGKMLEECYKSFLDSDYNTMLPRVIKKLESEDAQMLS